MAGLRPLSSTNSPLVKRIRALGARSPRGRADRFVLDGVRLIEEAVAAGVVLEVCLYDPAAGTAPRVNALLAVLRAAGVRLVPAAPHVVAAASQVETPQGIVAVAHRPRFPPEVPLDAAALLVVADGVQDPGNLGTIVRVADATAATAVLVTGAAADPYHPKTVRAAMGSLFHLPVFKMDAAALIGTLRDHAVRVLVADRRGAVDYRAVDYSPPVALVLGSEAHGPDARWMTAAAAQVCIPIYGRAESLNVALAAGLLLYEARRVPRGAEVRDDGRIRPPG